MTDTSARSVTERPRSRARLQLRRIGTITVTLAVIGGTAGAVVLGVDAISRAPDGGADVIAPLMPVGFMEVEIEPGYAVTRTFTGQIEAAATTDLGFELGGRITRVLVDEGDRVAAGEVLVLLDTSALGPERAAVEAELAALGAAPG